MSLHVFRKRAMFHSRAPPPPPLLLLLLLLGVGEPDAEGKTTRMSLCHVCYGSSWTSYFVLDWNPLPGRLSDFSWNFCLIMFLFCTSYSYPWINAISFSSSKGWLLAMEIQSTCSVKSRALFLLLEVVDATCFRWFDGDKQRYASLKKSTIWSVLKSAAERGSELLWRSRRLFSQARHVWNLSLSPSTTPVKSD